MKGIGLMLRRRGVLVAATAFASLGFASAASAATFNVNDTRDFPQSPTASSGSCVSTASTCTLRAAIMAANENGGSNTINVPAGTYPVSNSSTTTGSGYTPCNKDESIDDLKVNDCNNSTSITIIGAGSGQTVINNPGGSSGFRLFTLFPNGTLDLQKMTVENGYADGSGTTNSGQDTYDGGAVDSLGHLSAESDTFTGNYAHDYGGAIAAENGSGSTFSGSGDVFQNNDGYGSGGGGLYTDAPNDVTVSFSLFQANNSGDDDGGAIEGGTHAAGLTLNFDNLVQNVSYYGGGLYYYGSGALTITNSLFSQNQAISSSEYGGAIVNGGSANTNISNTSFDGNSAYYGGAIYDDSSSALNLTQDKFNNNSAPGDGGALDLDSSSATTSLLSDELDGNNTTGDGGAIYWEAGALVLKGSSFVLNTAANGGALADEASSGLVNKDALAIGDVTMSRNTASGDGGGIYNDSEYNPLTMVNDTIAFNNAASGEGGGVYGADEFVSDNTNVFGVENTTVAENSGGDCESGAPFKDSSSPSPLDQGNNNDSDQSCFGGVGGPNDKTGVNPLLANPANNGGPAAGGPGDTETVQTDAEQSNSPLIDAGNNNGCPSVDERGVSRPQGKACDIGAFEFGANPTSTTSTTTTGVTTTTSKTTTTTKTTTTHKPGKKPTKCKKGHHKSHGKCVKNKKHKKHKKKHKK